MSGERLAILREHAYTAARYTLYQVDPEAVEAMIETVEQLFKLLEGVEKRVLG